MVRLTILRHPHAVRAVRRIHAVSIISLTFLVLFNTDTAQAVTKTQLENTSAQIQNLNQSIKAEDARISVLEKEIWGLDRQILDTRKIVREERSEDRKQIYDARRDLKRQEFEIDSIDKDIALVDFDIEVLNRDIDRDKQRFAEMNVLKQSMEEGEFNKRQAEYQRQMAVLQDKKKPMQLQLEQSRGNLAQLKSQVTGLANDTDDLSLDKDPRIAGLLQKRDRASTELIGLRNQIKNDNNRIAGLKDDYQNLSAQFKREQAAQLQAKSNVKKTVTVTSGVTAAPAAEIKLDGTEYGSYVFVISGDQEPEIEQTLRLKNWVESYGAKYIQANWNGFNDNTGPKSTAGFKEAFRSYIRQIPKEAKLVLIGHGLGGGAAIEAATEIAFSEARTIDFLAVLDPIGQKNLRANIVYNTDGSCSDPDFKDEMTNSDYVECIKSSKKRLITANIKHFYNRWQKDAQGPLDFQRQIPSLDINGKIVNVPTATGRFDIAANIDSDQKRLYFAGDKKAHLLLLTEEAKQLPKLLVQHLR